MPSRVPEGQLEPRFEAVRRAIDRHRSGARSAPVSSDQRAAFAELCEFVDTQATGPGALDPGAWVLDAGCGTGRSSALLHKLHGQAVVGIDRSASRLARAPDADTPGVLCLRADMPSIWRLLVESRRVAEHCYLLYPNPAPKPSMLTRRWHAHPCFADILRSCHQLEMRTNWSVYAHEFAHAMSYCRGVEHEVETLSSERAEALSPFELKYASSGHRLYRVRGRAESGGTLIP